MLPESPQLLEITWSLRKVKTYKVVFLYPTWTGQSALELDGKVHLFGGSKVVLTLLGVDGRTASVGTGWESPAPGGGRTRL